MTRWAARVCILFVLTLSACQTGPGPGDSRVRHMPASYVELDHAPWTRDAVIYQINTRQFTPAGTFEAAEDELNRLARLGVDILWLMPIHPIGEARRKGMLGSPYSVRDYYGVNPEFGALADLISFVDTAHALGMRVILDWVANHTAWDNQLITEHPQWYRRDPDGAMQPPPWTDWSDTADLDYSKAGLRRYMADAMAYWVRTVGVDGYRADVAGYVPLDFWETVRRELDAIKPVFLLAEWEQRDLHARAFDATYAWSFKDALQAAANGDGVAALEGYFGNHQNTWPRDGYRLVYTDNHDQNAWDGAAPDIYGDAYQAAIVTSFLVPGIQTIYNGQEAGLARKLAFFEKDPIGWRDSPLNTLFARLTALKSDNRALWNGTAGGVLQRVSNTQAAHVFSFLREAQGDRVFAAINFSAEARQVAFTSRFHQGAWRDGETGQEIVLRGDTQMRLPAWGWRILVSEQDGLQPN